MPTATLIVLLSAALDAAVLWGLWRLARRAVGGRAEPARRRAKALETEMGQALAMHRDVLPTDRADALAGAIAALRAARKKERGRGPEAVAALDAACKAARPALEAALGAAPKRPFPELYTWVETAIVAFGVAMAFRAYFLQPFKIPTGSMQPTLYGTHSVACDAPTFADRFAPLKVLKWAVTGRWYRDVVAHASGTLGVGSDRDGAPGYVLLSVAGEVYKVPEDAARRGELGLERFVSGMADNPFDRAASAARAIVRRGDRVWSGYVIAGDQVFVNRLLWNLRPPRRDETVVFATSAPALVLGDRAAAAASDGPGGQAHRFPFLGLPLRLAYRPIPQLPAAQHYIKRLVGMPGEHVSIDPPRLLVDGAPVEGAPGVARVEGMGPSATGPEYAGYRNIDDEGMPQPHAPGFLQEAGDSIALGDEYLPMGDNTRSSFDGRYWGPVPRPQMLGPAACVYWPLSVRWGFGAVRD
jgi:signal peptidase I